MKQYDFFNLNGKTAIITGGGNGIGKAICGILSEYGANVVVSDLKLEDAQIVSDQINENGGIALPVLCNVTKDEDLVNLVKVTIEKFGGIDILVNNAGGGGAGRENPYKINIDNFKWVFELNVFSSWRLSQLCAPEMGKRGGGSIINITSMSSINKSPNISAYSSAKAAINHMTANLAFDYGANNIRINAVGPGATRTRSGPQMPRRTD